jgi:predicted RNase H-like HicB family nuclease
MFQYSFTLAWSDEDAGYIATVPEFPGISGFGETPVQAVKEAMGAVRLAIEVMEEDGETPPEAEKLIRYSGQIRLRMPKTLHRNLAIASQKDGVSLNSYILSLIQNRSAREKAFEEVLNKLEKVISPQPIVFTLATGASDHAATGLYAVENRNVVEYCPTEGGTTAGRTLGASGLSDDTVH